MSTRLDTDQLALGRQQNHAQTRGALTVPEEIDQHTWDETLAEFDGHLMQSWRWGEFKRHEGWRVERILLSGASGTGMAQVLFWPRGPVSTAFIPRGPLIAGDRAVVAAALLPLIDAACRRHRTLILGIEAGDASAYTEAPERFGFTVSATRYSPGRTVMVPLLDDEPLLAQMNSGTRHKVRRAQRNGVEVRQATPDEASILSFHTLLRQTAERQGFGINPPAHYLEALRVLGDDAALHVASVAGVDVAGLIAARSGAAAIYLFGASATEQPVRGATALLQFEAMRWARSRGSHRYDLWGIDNPLIATDDDSLDRSPSRECAEGDGLCQFKVGFGGDIVVLPRRIERHYHPHLVGMLRRATDLRQSIRP